MIKKNKTLLIVSIIVIISIILLTNIEYKVTSNSLKQDIEHQLQNKVEVESKAMDIWLLKKKKLIEKLSTSLEEVNYDKNTHLSLMKLYKKKMNVYGIFSGFQDGLYMDTQGVWESNYDPRVKTWYKKIVADQGTLVLGPMYYADVTGRKISYISIGTIFKKEKSIYGVIGSEIRTKEIYNKFENVQILNTGYITLINTDDGKIIFHPDNELIGKTLKNIGLDELEKKLNSKEYLKVNYKYDGIEKRAISKKLDEAPWLVVAIIEKNKIVNIINKLQSKFIWIGILLIFIYLMFTCYFYKKINSK